MSNYFNLKDKVILVTGGCSGAGVMIAQAFRNEGCKVIVTYNKHKVEQEDAYYFDQADINGVKPLLETIYQKYGHIDVLVNNAGIYPSMSIEEVNEKVWDEMLDVNLKGVFFLSREIAEKMDNGSIINISSINASNPAVKLTPYGASKAAIEFLTKSLAYNYGPKVRVNCIAPGLIYKEGQEKWIPGWRESYSERSALHRLVQAEEIGKAALFFASDLSSAVTGQTLTVDCGVMLAPCFDNR